MKYDVFTLSCLIEKREAIAESASDCDGDPCNQYYDSDLLGRCCAMRSDVTGCKNNIVSTVKHVFSAS